MYEIDNCSTDASAGFDVVTLIDNDLYRLHRHGTYNSPRVARLEADDLRDELQQPVHVVQRH